MASSNRTFSLLPTVLLSLVIGTVLGVLLLLLFGRHVGNPDTVSAVNSGIPGTTVIDRDNRNAASNAGTTGNAASSDTTNGAASNGAASNGTTTNGGPVSGGEAATINSASTTGDTSTSQSGTNADAQGGEVRLSQTVDGTKFTGNGAELYVQACQACHQEGGKGARGAGIYPALANNPKLATAAYPLSMVMFGNGGMPGFGHYLTDQQISDVVNYVRSDLNKNTDKVTPDDVKKLRPTKPDYMIFGEAAG